MSQPDGRSIVTTDEVINTIAEVLREADEDFIAEIVEKVLDTKLKYLEDGFWEIVV